MADVIKNLDSNERTQVSDPFAPAVASRSRPDIKECLALPRQTKSLTDYFPLIVWVVALATLLFIPLKIISYGFLAPGDARRHVAKAFTAKPYTEIVVMRPEYRMDHSPGWEWVLSNVHRATGWGPDALMSFSIISLMLSVFLAPLPWLRRPEAWLAALLAQLIAIPELMTRLVQARPYLLTEGVLIALLFAWSKDTERRPTRLKLILTSLAIGASVWVHGAWYLWALPVLAFLAAGRPQASIWLGCCILMGTGAGATLTGHPIEFLRQALDIIRTVSQEQVPQWLLVGEFRPSYGEFTTAVLVGLVFLWRRQPKTVAVPGTHEMAFPESSSPEVSRPQNEKSSGGKARIRSAVAGPGAPAFCLMVICWVLGFKADRFWADWGIPAALVWLTLQIQAGMTEAWNHDAPKRLLLCGLFVIPLFLHSTNDLDRRYTGTLTESFLDANEPALQGWLPENRGIFYSAHMDVFYNTFYKNPDANWRYILGMEPALMPPSDLQIFRNIQLSQYSFKAYEPWVQKMNAADRLAIRCSGQPPLSQLEWTNAVGDIWLGRLPKRR